MFHFCHYRKTIEKIDLIQDLEKKGEYFLILNKKIESLRGIIDLDDMAIQVLSKIPSQTRFCQEVQFELAKIYSRNITTESPENFLEIAFTYLCMAGSHPGAAALRVEVMKKIFSHTFSFDSQLDPTATGGLFKILKGSEEMYKENDNLRRKLALLEQNRKPELQDQQKKIVPSFSDKTKKQDQGVLDFEEKKGEKGEGHEGKKRKALVL